MAKVCVRDWMHPGVISCSPDTPVNEVATTIADHRISALVVIDEAGLAAGVVSQTDLANAAFVQPYFKYWKGLTARHLMSSPVLSVRPDAPIEEALNLLRERKIHRLIVTEPARGGEVPVGIISITDIVTRMEIPHE
ncbi:MAG: HPP family protein [Candidatus Methylomirabilia bacterium]